MSHVTASAADDYEKALNSLLNRAATPSEEKSNVTFYIAAAVQRLYRAFDYLFSTRTAVVTPTTAGVADVSDLDLGPLPAILGVTDSTSLGSYTFVPYSEFSNYSQGGRVYTILLNEDNDYVIVSSEAGRALTITYIEAPEVSSNNAVFTPMVVAKGALIYYYQSTDREGDTSVEEDQFKQEVSEIIEAQNRRAPQRFVRTARDTTGHYIGRS